MKPIGHGVDYSTWNRRTADWDYWSAPTKLRDGVIAPPPRLKGKSRLGISPEAAARSLPLGARKIGSGPIARGMVAEPMGAASLAADTGKILSLAAAAFLIWHFWSKR